MRQPELGIKVTELRREKGMTQEQLADLCEVSPRTIQRIETGVVDPRTFTVKMLGEALGFDFAAEETGNEVLWLSLLHLSTVLSFVLLPLLIWTWKKSKSVRLNQHGKAVLNFQITVTLVLFGCLLLVMAVVPFSIQFFELEGELSLRGGLLMLSVSMPLFLTLGFAFIQGVLNTGRVLNDRDCHYPLSIQFLK